MGEAAAALAHVPFIDADDVHPPRNIELMTAGTPLTDEDREPWLDAVAAQAVALAPCVIACSALSRRHRDRLRSAAPGIRFVVLDVPLDVLQDRLEARTGHFMTAAMLDSQLMAREHPEREADVEVVDGTASVADLAERVASLLAAQVD